MRHRRRNVTALPTNGTGSYLSRFVHRRVPLSPAGREPAIPSHLHLHSLKWARFMLPSHFLESSHIFIPNSADPIVFFFFKHSPQIVQFLPSSHWDALTGNSCTEVRGPPAPLRPHWWLLMAVWGSHRFLPRRLISIHSLFLTRSCQTAVCTCHLWWMPAVSQSRMVREPASPSHRLDLF